MAQQMYSKPTYLDVPKTGGTYVPKSGLYTNSYVPIATTYTPKTPSTYSSTTPNSNLNGGPYRPNPTSYASNPTSNGANSGGYVPKYTSYLSQK